MNAVEVLS